MTVQRRLTRTLRAKNGATLVYQPVEDGDDVVL